MSKKKKAKPADLTFCVAGYYDPLKYVLGKEPRIVRVTAIVFNTVSEKNVERLEFSGADSLNEVTDKAVALAAKYNTPLRFISEPVPLEKCPCGCGNWLDRIITAADLAESPN